MVWGRDLRTSVFCTREAPASLETDNVLFDRVIDNLLQNAAKATLKRSIVVELSGKPKILSVKISDTGPGIADERIEKAFQVGESTFAKEGRGSGLGLAIVVRLLDQIGGKLEVMSRPNLGTAFWAHFPVQLPKQEPGEQVALPTAGMDDIIERVVTIRRIK